MKTLQHKFVDFIPEILEEGVLYITIKYKSAAHKCMCGCGNKVVTPISPAGWKMIFDGKAVSLTPSIGNWNLECRSHYYITNSEVSWVKDWCKNENTDKAKKETVKKKKEKKESIIKIALKKINKKEKK